MTRQDSAFDVVIDGKGYMLARQGQMNTGARAYQSESVGASILQQSPEGQPYGNQPAIIEIPVVFTDLSHGYGEERRIHERRYYYAENIDCRFPGMILPGPYIHPVDLNMNDLITGFFEQNGELYVLGGRSCKKIARNDAVTTDKTFGAGTRSTGLALFDQDAYIAMGWEESIWMRSHAGVWTQSDDVRLKSMAVFRDKMWASVGDNSVAACGWDFLNWANWTSAYNIGGSANPITGMVELEDKLFIGKTDGLYALTQDGTAVQLLPEIAHGIDPENCKALKVWHGSLIVPHLRGLLRFQSGGDQANLVTAITPGWDAPKSCPVVGRITAMCGEVRWLFAALLTVDGHTYILAGREPGANEAVSMPMIWHPIAKLHSVTCTAMHLSGLWENPRLWLGIGQDAGYIILPRSTDNPYFDPSCQYAPSGTLYFSSHSLGSATVAKVFKYIEVKGRHLHTNRPIRAYYKADNRPWTLAGEATSGPTFAMALPIPGVPANEMQLRLDIQMKGLDCPLVIESIAARGAERPRMVEVVSLTIRCADKMQNKEGVTDRRSGAEIFESLKALEQIQASILFRDRLGLERRVLLLSPVTRSEANALKDQAPEDLAVVRLAMFDSPTNTAPSYGIYDDPLSVWDGDHVWAEGDVFTWGSSKWGNGDYWGL